MNQRTHFTALITQEDACIVVSFAAPPQKKTPQAKDMPALFSLLCCKTFLTSYVSSAFVFMALQKQQAEDVWEQFVNYEPVVDVS